MGTGDCLVGVWSPESVLKRLEDEHQESLQLIFTSLDEVDIDRINKVQKPVFMDLLQEKQGILR